MTDIYKTETIEHGGKKYRVDFAIDYDAGEPWENGDCHGVVSGWTTRSKRPCERILNTDRGSSRFYDVQASIQKAVSVWGVASGKKAAEQVDKDYHYLRAWCNDEWHYCGIVVTVLGDDCADTDISASLWGIESDADNYHADVVAELIADCEKQSARRIYAGATVGV